MARLAQGGPRAVQRDRAAWRGRDRVARHAGRHGSKWHQIWNAHAITERRSSTDTYGSDHRGARDQAPLRRFDNPVRCQPDGDCDPSSRRTTSHVTPSVEARIVIAFARLRPMLRIGRGRVAIAAGRTSGDEQSKETRRTPGLGVDPHPMCVSNGSGMMLLALTIAFTAVVTALCAGIAGGRRRRQMRLLAARR